MQDQEPNVIGQHIGNGDGKIKIKTIREHFFGTLESFPDYAITAARFQVILHVVIVDG